MPLLHLLFVLLNTFLPFPDYRCSAAALDKKRLGKQRLEGVQLVNLIENISYLGDYYKNPVPTDPYDGYDWIRRVVKLYENDPLKPTTRITSIGETKKIKLGYITHPIVLTWLHHINSLKEYIDCCIDEWVARGYNNTMLRFGVTQAPRPKWADDPYIHQTHLVNLFYKEYLSYQNVLLPHFSYDWYDCFERRWKSLLSLPDLNVTTSKIAFHLTTHMVAIVPLTTVPKDVPECKLLDIPSYLFRDDFLSVARQGYIGYFWPYTPKLSAGNQGTADPGNQGTADPGRRYK
jgi:hypothetical protein